ncbi:MAG: GNAT family N-acetyltransferase [Dehalococcoidia bacterium]|nr:GNAT family N-acetyltransferase [Dehalococcoidia bacterium]
MIPRWLRWGRDADRREDASASSAYVAEGDKIRLREKRPEDAAADYAWRRDPELASFDAVPPISLTFDEFLREYQYELASLGPRRRRFAIETKTGKHIGNCSLFNVDERRKQAELGIMIGDRAYWGRGYGADTVRTLVRYAFEVMRLDRVYLYTLEWNERAQHSFRNAGFRETSRVSDDRNRFVVMEVLRHEYEARAPREPNPF